jgi:hypothetical protein
MWGVFRLRTEDRGQRTEDRRQKHGYDNKGEERTKESFVAYQQLNLASLYLNVSMKTLLWSTLLLSKRLLTVK